AGRKDCLAGARLFEICDQAIEAASEHQPSRHRSLVLLRLRLPSSLQFASIVDQEQSQSHSPLITAVTANFGASNGRQAIAHLIRVESSTDEFLYTARNRSSDIPLGPISNSTGLFAFLSSNKSANITYSPS